MNAEVACFPSAMFSSRQANTRHCIRAAFLLPEGNTPGLFHLFGDHDGYSLPLVKIYESCMVTVSLHQSLKDISTWHRISHVASQIAAACSMGSYPQGLTGGSTFVGDAGLIKVSV